MRGGTASGQGLRGVSGLATQDRDAARLGKRWPSHGEKQDHGTNETGHTMKRTQAFAVSQCEIASNCSSDSLPVQFY
jgi:hypothetical protein